MSIDQIHRIFAVRYASGFVTPRSSVSRQAPGTEPVDGIPPLIFVQVNDRFVRHRIHSLAAAPKAFEEAATVEPRVNPNGPIFCNGPNNSSGVTLDSSQMASHLRP